MEERLGLAPRKVRVKARATAGGTWAKGKWGTVRGGASKRARASWWARKAAAGGGWREQRAASPDTLWRVRAGVRASPPESGEGGGQRGRTRGGRSGRWGGHAAPFAPSLPRSCRRRRSAAAAPAAILGSLCGGGDDPRLGCGTRLPSVSPA